MRSRETGIRGEDEAARYLLGHGFDLLHRNWRNGRYELDIVAVREGVLHIVEVKCRRADGLTRPEEAMTRAKFRALMRAAQFYVELYGLDMDVQFDLVAVTAFPDGAFDVAYIPDAMVPHW